MAKELSPWIANLVKDHDANHGPDLSVSYDGLWAVQIEEFETYRDPKNPNDHTQLIALASDGHHRIRLVFDVKETDKIYSNNSSTSRMTTHIRAIYHLHTFHLSLPSTSPPRPHPSSNTRPPPSWPQPFLEIHPSSWSYLCGGPSEPAYASQARSLVVPIGGLKTLGQRRGWLEEWIKDRSELQQQRIAQKDAQPPPNLGEPSSSISPTPTFRPKPRSFKKTTSNISLFGNKDAEEKGLTPEQPRGRNLHDIVRVVLGIWWDEIYGSDPGRGREGLRAIREGEGEGEEGVGSGPGPGTSGPPPGLLGPEKLVTLVKDLVVQQSKVGVEILRQMRVMNEGEVGEMLKGIGTFGLDLDAMDEDDEEATAEAGPIPVPQSPVTANNAPRDPPAPPPAAAENEEEEEEQYLLSSGDALNNALLELRTSQIERNAHGDGNGNAVAGPSRLREPEKSSEQEEEDVDMEVEVEQEGEQAVVEEEEAPAPAPAPVEEEQEEDVQSRGRRASIDQDEAVAAEPLPKRVLRSSKVVEKDKTKKGSKTKVNGNKKRSSSGAKKKSKRLSSAIVEDSDEYARTPSETERDGPARAGEGNEEEEMVWEPTPPQKQPALSEAAKRKLRRKSGAVIDEEPTPSMVQRANTLAAKARPSIVGLRGGRRPVFMDEGEEDSSDDEELELLQAREAEEQEDQEEPEAERNQENVEDMDVDVVVDGIQDPQDPRTPVDQMINTDPSLPPPSSDPRATIRSDSPYEPRQDESFGEQFGVIAPAPAPAKSMPQAMRRIRLDTPSTQGSEEEDEIPTISPRKRKQPTEDENGTPVAGAGAVSERESKRRRLLEKQKRIQEELRALEEGGSQSDEVEEEDMAVNLQAESETMAEDLEPLGENVVPQSQAASHTGWTNSHSIESQTKSSGTTNTRPLTPASSSDYVGGQTPQQKVAASQAQEEEADQNVGGSYPGSSPPARTDNPSSPPQEPAQSVDIQHISDSPAATVDVAERREEQSTVETRRKRFNLDVGISVRSIILMRREFGLTA